MIGRLTALIGVMLILLACSLSTTRTDDEPRTIYVTATPGPMIETATVAPSATLPAPTVALSPLPADRSIPTANPVRFPVDFNAPREHIVRSGDTLIGIAQAYGTSLDALLAINDLLDPNTLEIGQVIGLPGIPTQETPNVKLIPDGRFVRGPGSQTFDVVAFVESQPGYLRRVSDEVDTRQADGSIQTETLSGAAIVERISVEYSLDPRLLLAVLEYAAGWLSQPNPPGPTRERPFDVDRDGFYRQLSWAANQLSFGYYGWKYRGWTTLELSGTERYLYASGLNAGTVALQYFLSTQLDAAAWFRAVSDERGFFSTYVGYFGDPFAGTLDPIVPVDLVQPAMILPFNPGETWFFTGGAHGGWGSGSAWSAVDFAPPDERDDGRLCYTSDYQVVAVAPGVIARSDEGAVVLDLDGDGDETTGWTVFYLHLDERITAGAVVQAGDAIGRASCEGGFSTATHLHIGRRYNGEWIPADCFVCSPFDARPPFVLGGWQVIGIRNQEYQGFLEGGGERRTAEQGRLSLVNRISW